MDLSDVMREAEIRALELLGHDLPDVLNHLARVAVKVSGARSAEINVITSTSQHTVVSAYGETGSRDARESFCATIVRDPRRLHVVPDASADPRFAENAFVTSGAITTYAASQLVTSTGVPIGTLCVFDPEPCDVPAEAMEVLAELSEAVMDVLEARREVHDLKDSLAELADGSRELRRSNEHLAAFAGQVSHDVQGPLASVLMALQLLQEDPTRSTERLLATAVSSAQRMRATTAGLMDFAVLGGRLRPTELDMGRIVREVLADLQDRQGRARVEYDDLPWVWGDDVQVRGVTQNLVANALKYAGGVARPLVRVSGRIEGATTRITVSDNGPGVPLEERAAIFELLVRGEGAEHSGLDGLGIGLATCRRILEAHGGRIGVGESSLGGAEFWFELPVPAEATARLRSQVQRALAG